MEETKEFLTKEEVTPIAKEYIKELYDIESYYLDSIEGHEDDKLFMDSLFKNAKTRSCTNDSRKVVLIADPSVDKDTIARAALKPVNNGYGYTIVVYFVPGLFNSVKGLKKMFEIAEQFIWHEATHLARMNILGTDEAHEGDISDIEYLNTAAELNAFAIQSLSTTDDIDLAMETYECCAPGEVLETFKTIVNNLKNGISEDRFEESASFTPSTFKRSLKDDIINPYQNYYTGLNFETTIDKYFEKEDLPFELEHSAYDESTRTLKINVCEHLKAYGDGYSREYTYKGDRATHEKNMFIFDESLSQEDAEIIYPLGLVKTGTHYPASSFYYSDPYWDGKPKKLHWVDHIILNILKEYD